MRILIAAAVGDSSQTGMGKWAHRVAEALELRGHCVALFFDRDVLGERRTAFAKTLLYPIWLTRPASLKRDFDLVIVHEPSGFWYGLARKVMPNLPPLIAMCHNVEAKCFEHRIRGIRAGYSKVPWTTRVKQPLFRRWQSNGTIRLADHVFCLSTEDLEYLKSRLGRRPNQVTRLVNGVAAEDFVQRTTADPGLSILFVGGWLEIKGTSIVPAAFRQLRQQMPDARMTIAGAGADGDVVLDSFEADDRKHVRVISGAVDAAAVRELYQSHAVFFMPSLSEGSPLSLLEAMAAGTPIAAARVGGIPDVVRHGTDGLLFDPGDAQAAMDSLFRILSDRALGRTLGAAARERVREFTWSATAQAIERAARDVVGRMR